MFKRVEKRRRRKEEEEELGLDDDMKEVLGVQDTDSDESESDSDSETDSEKGSAIGEQEVDREVDEEDEEEATGSEGDISNDEGELENPVITVEDALADPVYLVSLDPDVKACLVCPGKSLKHPKMIEVHKASAVRQFLILFVYWNSNKALRLIGGASRVLLRSQQKQALTTTRGIY